MDKISSLANLLRTKKPTTVKITNPMYEQPPNPRRPSEQMHEDMEGIFSNEGAHEDFSLSHLTSAQATSSPWGSGYGEGSMVREPGDARVREMDIAFHRKDTFPHVHHPLKPQHQRKGSRKKHHREGDGSHSSSARLEKIKSKEKQDKDKEKKSRVLFEVGDYDTDDALPKKEDRKARKESTGHETDGDEDKPLLAGAGAAQVIKSGFKPTEEAKLPYADETCKKSRVHFDIGEEEEQPEMEHRARKRRSYKNRRLDGVEDPAWRRHPGSEHNLQARSTPTHTEGEDVNLAEQDLDHLTSHRFDDPSAYRRPRLRARSSVSSIIHMTADETEEETKKKKKKGGLTDRQMPIMSMKKNYDHSPHEVFVELEELRYTDQGLQWKETARWIKYEEDVDDVDNRWGKPHLAFLNFHALFSLRKGLEAGAVLLDLEERDLPSIAARVVDKMIACDQIPPDQREAVIRVLLLRHRHLHDTQTPFRLPSISSRPNLQSSEEKIHSSATSPNLEGGLRSSVRKAGLSNLFHVNTFSGFLRSSSTDDTSSVVANGVSKDPKSGIKRTHSSHDTYTQIDIDVEAAAKESRDNAKNKELMKKIPEGAEATAVLVGAVDFLKHPTIAFVRLAEGVMMDNLVEVPIPVRFMFVLLGPFHGEMDYHEVGRSISTLMSDKSFHEVAYRAHSRGQLLSAINEFLNASIVLPPSDWSNKDLVQVDEIQAKAAQMKKKKESMRSKRHQGASAEAHVTAGDGDGGDKKPPPRDPLVRVGKPFYGLIQDIKIRYSQYLSDITDGFSGQVAAAAIFIFFAALSAAITFGGMYGDQTENLLGVGETLLISSVNGLIFGVFACQPLLIVGATGPLMIFDMSLYQFCKTYEVDFLSMRVWIGVWITVFGLMVAAFEAVAIVKKFTRFTEEIFSTLVCLIFIYESFSKLADIFRDHPLQAEYTLMDINHTQVLDELEDSADNDSLVNTTHRLVRRMVSEANDSISGMIVNGSLVNATNAEGEEVDTVVSPQPNTALLSLILMVGTFIIAFKLKHFRNSKFLGRSVRRALGDFGVPISIFLMVLLDYLVEDTYTDKLTMPPGIQPSDPTVRGWVINPIGVTKPLPVWCMFIAAPASLLLFFLIFLEENICHLVLSKPEKNMKKGSGFHWDLVLSCFINFVSGIFGAPFMGPACVRTISHTSALTIMSSTHAPGESPRIIGVQEQRVSGILVSVMIGLSVLAAAVLNLVPKAVLLGIFLYMGVSSTAGIQLLERLILVLMPVKHHPNLPYVKKVRTWKMHAFTGIQVLMLVILWVVKQSPAALCFPFVLMLLIPLRLYLLPYGFNNPELSALDGKEASGQMDKEEEPDFFQEAHDLPTHLDHHHQS